MTLIELLFFLLYLLPSFACMVCLTISYYKSYLAAKKIDKILEKISDDKHEFTIMFDTDSSVIFDTFSIYLVSFIPIYNIYYMACCIEELNFSVKDIMKDYIEELGLTEILEKNGIDVE